VGADDFMPEICWTRYFMKAQGYDVKDNILFQDNNSSIILEKNGKASSSKRTKHINIRYLFITYRVSKEEVSGVWCPTGDMIGDYTTKPLQGALFQKFRDHIMGVTPARDPGTGKTDDSVGKTETNKSKSKKGKATYVLPPGKDAAPQGCWGNRTRDRAKLGTVFVENIADLTIFNHSKGNSGSYPHATCVGMHNHSKSKFLLHLTS
jgi:hypothetical protein